MERVLILGATSAIASQVAYHHARRGDRLHLVGRDPDKLAAVAQACANTHVSTQTADFAQLEQNEAVIRDALEALGGLDRVLIAHGLLSDQQVTEHSFADAELSLRTNFMSVVSLLIPLANHLETARAGRMGVITSVAGERGRPRNYTYGAAKGALNVYLQGLRSRLYPTGVSVTTLKLGPVDTPMTRDHKKNLLFARADQVAFDILVAMDGCRPEVFVPSFWGLIMPLVRLAPESLFQKLAFLSGR